MKEITALAIASLFASGCGTIAMQMAYQEGGPDPDWPLPYIYGGTSFDVVMVVGGATSGNEASILTLMVFDLPFSVVADTILLPLTIYQQIDRAFWTEERFIQSLSHPDSAVRAHAARWLGLWDETTSEGIVALRGVLTDPAPEVRFEAIVALHERESLPVSDLILLVRDDDARNRREVARTLGESGSDSDSVGSALATLLMDDDDSWVRHEVAKALGLIGSRSDTTIRALSEALNDEDVSVRIVAAYSLGEKGPAAAPAIPALASLLKDDEPNARLAAARSLRKLGPVARSAEPALRVALNDEDARVRDAAAEALTRIRNGNR